MSLESSSNDASPIDAEAFAWNRVSPSPQVGASMKGERRWPGRVVLFLALALVAAFPIAGAIALLSPKSKPPLPDRTVELCDGDRKSISGGMVFTFWKEGQPLLVGAGTEYFVVPPEDEQLLIKDPVIEAPRGVTASTLDLIIRLEQTGYSMRTGNGPIKTETKVSYKQYVISGRWSVSVSDECPPGAHEVTIRLPGIAAARDRFGAKSPRSDSVILRFRKV